MSIAAVSAPLAGRVAKPAGTICSFQGLRACADIVQVVWRNMQDFTLLEEIGRCLVPVLLKRGMSATLAESLLAAIAAAAGRSLA